jgi:peflin
MYGGPNYGGYHHAQSSSRSYQNPNQLGGSYSSGPYNNADPQLLQWFNAVDTDRSGSISVAELQAALVNGQCSFLILSPIVS